jgi:hypothetical protein
MHWNMAKHMDATEVWVLHFTLKVEGDDFQYPVPKDKSVNVMHVWHNADFSSYNVVCLKQIKT